MGASKKNLHFLLKCQEKQQTLHRHGGPQLSHVQGHRQSQPHTIFFSTNFSHFSIRGPCDRPPKRISPRDWIRGLHRVRFGSRRRPFHRSV